MSDTVGAARATWLALCAGAAAVFGVALQAMIQEGSLREAASLAWPPSRKSFPFLALLAAAFVVYTYKNSFSRYGMTAESKRVRETKRRLVIAQMAAVLRWDKDADAEDGDQESEATPKKPPSTKELWDMIYDDVEEQHVTAFDISAMEEPYASTRKLFEERISADLMKAVKYTELARENEAGTNSELLCKLDTTDMKEVMLYKDGTKLVELLDLLQNKIFKAFGKDILKDDRLLQQAEICRRITLREQRKTASLFIDIILPLLPMYLAAIMLMAFDSLTGPALWHSLSTLLDGVQSGTMSLEELQWLTIQNQIKFVFCVFAHLTSWTYAHKVTSQFRVKVRTQLMANLVRQDTAFFDIIPSGILQERLNRDAEDLASKIFHLVSRGSECACGLRREL